MFGHEEQEKAVYGTPFEVKAGDTELRPLSYPGKEVLLFDVFGGGWVSGCPAYEDSYCEYLRSKTGYSVVACDYSLAPWKKFPTQTEELYETVKQTAKSGEKIVLAGHSAGANLIAAVAILAGRRKEFEISALIFDYSVFDLARDPASRPQMAGNTIPLRAMKGFTQMYLRDGEDRFDPLASPLLMSEEEIGNFPPSFLLCCQQDNLRIDSYDFASRLRKHGRVCELLEVNEKHAFIENGMHEIFGEHTGETASAMAAIDRQLEWLREILASEEKE